MITLFMLGILILCGAIGLAGAVTVDQLEVLVVRRFGEIVGIKQPGLRWVCPWFYETQSIDLREKSVDNIKETVPTEDGIHMEFSVNVRFRPLQEISHEQAIELLKILDQQEENIRNEVLDALNTVIKNFTFEQIDTGHADADLHVALRGQLKTQLDTWGLKVTRLNIIDKEPADKDIRDAQNRKKRAELLAKAAEGPEQKLEVARANIYAKGKKIRSEADAEAVTRVKKAKTKAFKEQKDAGMTPLPIALTDLGDSAQEIAALVIEGLANKIKGGK